MWFWANILFCVKIILVLGVVCVKLENRAFGACEDAL